MIFHRSDGPIIKQSQSSEEGWLIIQTGLNRIILIRRVIVQANKIQILKTQATNWTTRVKNNNERTHDMKQNLIGQTCALLK